MATSRSGSRFDAFKRQRLKLTAEVGKTGNIYVLDKSTTGLHINDVDNLIGLFDRLVDQGSTVIVIEHNLDVIARSDWVIDMGPGAGQEGGAIVIEGPPGVLVKASSSIAAEFLAKRRGA